MEEFQCENVQCQVPVRHLDKEVQESVGHISLELRREIRAGDGDLEDIGRNKVSATSRGDEIGQEEGIAHSGSHPWLCIRTTWGNLKKKRFYLFVFREGKGRRKRGRETSMRGCFSHTPTPPTGDLARNPGICPDWESN